MPYDNILENVFDPNFIQNKYLKDQELHYWHFFLMRLLAQFQYLQKTRTKEEWYIKLIKKMMNKDIFRELWQKASLTKEKDVIGNFGFHSIIAEKDNTQRNNFYFFVLPVLKDPRFQVNFFMPAGSTKINGLPSL
jgi:hypothetical protein